MKPISQIMMMPNQDVILECVRICSLVAEDVENGNGMEEFFKEFHNHPGPIASLCEALILTRFNLPLDSYQQKLVSLFPDDIFL